VRKRLWKCGGLLAIGVLTLIVGNCFLPPDKAFNALMYGHDFLPFYTAGQFARAGRMDELYDPAATRIREHETCQQAGLVIHNEYGAFLNPPFAALAAAPLAARPYRTALWIWTAILIACLIAAILLMANMLRADWRVWGLIPLLLFTSLPAWQAMMHAQNTFFSLLVLALTVTFWRNGRPFAAGLTAGLLMFKPQLGVILALVLIITQGRRALWGFAITSSVLLLVSARSLGDYLQRMPANLRAIQVLPNYTWHRHVTFLAWWRMLLQGHTGALPTSLAHILAGACMLAMGVLLGITVWKTRRRTDWLIAATIVSMPLLMPYYMDYDLTLLSVAAVLCAADAMRYGLDRAVCMAWVVFYIVTEVNPVISGFTPIIPAVPVLATLSVLLIAKARQPIAAVQIPFPEYSLAA
jgi:Glycosyltransferase family 87